MLGLLLQFPSIARYDISDLIRSLNSKVPKLAACENDKCYDITDGDDDHEGRNQQLILPKTHDTP